jgi:hypothetical protein
MLAAIVVTGCAGPTAPGSLYVENRGGPDLVLFVAGAPPVSVPCGGGAVLVAGTGGMPRLPWQLEVRRAADGALVMREEVTQLPRWFVQIGDEVVGGRLNATAIEGPAGPPC